MDGQLLFYYIELPHGGKPSDLIASMQDHTVSLGENVTMDTPDDGVFSHDKADIAMISYIIEAVHAGKAVTCILSDNTDMYGLLVYEVCREEPGVQVADGAVGCDWDTISQAYAKDFSSLVDLLRDTL